MLNKNVLTIDTLMKLIPEETWKNFKAFNENNETLDRKSADIIATSIKSWALQKGATHFTHWFTPPFENTAEKHLSFNSKSNDGLIIEKFEGSDLIGNEPKIQLDQKTSNRDTFEARGYAKWDQDSPVFIYNNILCIPTTHVSFSGNCLDLKTPLLKSINLLKKAIIKICHHYERDLYNVEPYVGWEQEFYFIPIEDTKDRIDLQLTNQTLYGRYIKPNENGPSYFGRIPDNILNIFKELEEKAIHLGIPIKTWHNESSSNQYEIASIHEKMNISIDHNLLFMDLLKMISSKHGYRTNFHEKPFQSLSGSGKHCSWSILTEEGKNLVSPGKTPRNSLRFASLLLCVIKALKDNGDALTAIVRGLGNDQRLGKDDAPSHKNTFFLGEYLSKFFLEIHKKISNTEMTEKNKSELKNEFGKIPEILLNNKDSQRDSMIAFTGNKFEFRLIGASHNLSEFLIFWNTLVSKEILEFNDKIDSLIKSKHKRDEAIFLTLASYIENCKDVFINNKGIIRSDSINPISEQLDNTSLRTLASKNNIYNDTEYNNWINKKALNYINESNTTWECLKKIISSVTIPELNHYLNNINHELLQLKIIKDYNKRLINNLNEALQIVENGDKIQSKITSLIEKDEIMKAFEVVHISILPLINESRKLLFNIDKLLFTDIYSKSDNNKILGLSRL
jgi:glutamine synthetase